MVAYIYVLTEGKLYKSYIGQAIFLKVILIVSKNLYHPNRIQFMMFQLLLIEGSSKQIGF